MIAGVCFVRADEGTTSPRSGGREDAPLALHLAPVLFVLALVVVYLAICQLTRRPTAPAIFAVVGAVRGGAFLRVADAGGAVRAGAGPRPGWRTGTRSLDRADRAARPV